MAGRPARERVLRPPPRWPGPRIRPAYDSWLSTAITKQPEDGPAPSAERMFTALFDARRVPWPPSAEARWHLPVGVVRALERHLVCDPGP